MTAKTIPVTLALSEAPTLSLLKLVLVSSWGVTFRPHGIDFGMISVLANFCLLTVDLSLNKNPKVILKSSQLNMQGHFAR